MQRAWGTVGWGLMGPISGYLIDWWSGSSVTKDYTPAFLLVFLLGSVDILLSAATLKHARGHESGNFSHELHEVFARIHALRPMRYRGAFHVRL